MTDIQLLGRGEKLFVMLRALRDASPWQKLSLVFAGLGLLFLTLAAFVYLHDLTAVTPVYESSLTGDKSSVFVLEATPSATPKPAELSVDVSGAVKKPGVYRLEQGSRIGEAVEAAGGLTSKADLGYVHQSVNLAERLTDEGKIYIPEQGEEPAVTSSDETSTSPSKKNKISVNTANEKELLTLEGIGEARARTIIEQRPYVDLEELQEKTKIPLTVLQKLAEILEF